MVNHITEIFKNISIRGRYAFGVTCIEQYITENQLKNDWFTTLLNTLWEFTSSNQLDQWDDKINELTPACILDDHPENKPEDYKSLNTSQFYELKHLYQELPCQFIDLIDSVIEIGTGNLYGGTGEYSSHTLKPTIEAYTISNSILKTLPDIELFTKFNYADESGWGKTFERSDI